VFILSGVVGSFIYGIILDKYNKYKLVLCILCFSSIGAITMAMFILPLGNVPLFALNLMIVGVSVIPIIPVSYGFAVELTYPLSEAMSNGMMIMVS
jgi:MFS family permease